MTEEEIKSHVLRQVKSNIHIEEGQRVLELSYNGLLDYFGVSDVIMSS